MKTIGIIPARMASTRLPGKPLATLLGMPMIGHVWHRCKMSSSLSKLYVATCDREIAEYVESIGGQSVMTSSSHERASERVAEAVTNIEASEGEKFDAVVMIQGDEPLVTPSMIDLAVSELKQNKDIKCINLMAKITTDEEFNDPNEIKVVVDMNFDAIYFSREPIPSKKKSADQVCMRKQVCIIPFQRDFLKKFVELSPTALEIAESIDMLRIIEHGYKVRMVPIDEIVVSVDTAENLKAAEGMLKQDPLVPIYM